MKIKKFTVVVFALILVALLGVGIACAQSPEARATPAGPIYRLTPTPPPAEVEPAGLVPGIFGPFIQGGYGAPGTTSIVYFQTPYSMPPVVLVTPFVYSGLNPDYGGFWLSEVTTDYFVVKFDRADFLDGFNWAAFGQP